MGEKKWIEADIGTNQRKRWGRKKERKRKKSVPKTPSEKGSVR